VSFWPRLKIQFQTVGAVQLKDRLQMSVHLNGTSRNGTADDCMTWTQCYAKCWGWCSHTACQSVQM